MYAYTEVSRARDKQWLMHFPLAFFAMVMGLAGLSILWIKAAAVLEISTLPGQVFSTLSTLLYLALLGFYGAKVVRHPDAVRAELAHPVKLNFLATISISLLLLTICFRAFSLPWTSTTFVIGTALHFIITLYTLNCWIHRTDIEVTQTNPAWFIPVVGNIVVPIAMPATFSADIALFFFAIGMLFWMPLLAVVLNRLFFHHPIPQRLLPTLAILIAPPAVGFLSYLHLGQPIDFFAKFLFFSACFLTLLLATQLPRLTKVPFALSWWAYSFPLAAVSTAILTYSQYTQHSFFIGLSYFAVAITTLLIGLLVWRTAKAIQQGTICTTE